MHDQSFSDSWNISTLVSNIICRLGFSGVDHAYMLAIYVCTGRSDSGERGRYKYRRRVSAHSAPLSVVQLTSPRASLQAMLWICLLFHVYSNADTVHSINSGCPEAGPIQSYLTPPVTWDLHHGETILLLLLLPPNPVYQHRSLGLSCQVS